MRFVSIDFETANRYWSSACSVGVAVADESGVIDEWYTLINPLMDFEEQNIQVHGILPRDVEDAPTFKEIWPKLSSYLAGNVVIAHNASFDMGVIRKAVARYGLEMPDFDYLCTRIIGKKVWPDMENHRLNTLAASKEIMFEHHNAMEDARVAANIFLHAMADSGVQSIEELTKTLKVSRKSIHDTSSSGSRSRYGDIKPQTDQFDPAHPFYRKQVMFTGTMKSLKRKDAIQRLVNVGGVHTDKMDTSTRYLVVGARDYEKFAAGKKTSKLVQAERMIENGRPLHIISEEKFLSLV
ncbi:exonuclease domain-containing protein [Terribacillus aidingensis]|uniref:exonuclease domain-containing protein n=1 Tax=Terribacillus aidingensis TaxID=586416 RepID=UPI00344FCF09